MFDFSLPELMVVMVVALIVIGPERLPKVARTMGHLYGRARRYVNGVKADISRDLAIEEYRELQQKVQAEASALESSVREAGLTAQQHLQEINRKVAEAQYGVQSPAQPIAESSSLPTDSVQPQPVSSATLPHDKS